jgi:regulator of protease activity HflC (stomatin/prohibitin superfamily)
MEFVIPVLIIVIVVVVVLAAMSVRIAREYERGVVFRFGRLIDLKGPGLFLIIPFGIDRLFKIDLRVITLEVQPQEVITKDNVTIKVKAVVWFQVVDPRVAVTKVANYYQATTQVAETTLRGTIGQHELDELLAHRDRINASLKEVIDRQTEPWGIQVSIVEVKDIELPQTMQRAMAKQAEAEREKRAKVITAEGEFQASQTLANAARIIQTEPAAIALRYMQTLVEIGFEKNTTIVFPLPIELIRPMLEAGERLRPLVPDPAAAAGSEPFLKED